MADERSSRPATSVQLDEVLYELQRLGRNLRVTAIDPRTNIEVTIVGGAGCGETALKRLAARKLVYVITKRRLTESDGG